MYLVSLGNIKSGMLFSTIEKVYVALRTDLDIKIKQKHQSAFSDYYNRAIPLTFEEFLTNSYYISSVHWIPLDEDYNAEHKNENRLSAEKLLRLFKAAGLM